MTEDNYPNVSSSKPMASPDSSAVTKQRKRRKWDQPAESLVSAGVVVPAILPSGNLGSLVGVTLPGVVPVSRAVLFTNPPTASCATLPQVLQTPTLQPHAAALVQKLNQPKIQDELIAREIVINDADSAIRYKLTKRQTQEEIQRCTGAVVITRGKYRPPNAPSEGEKPLYLHISAGAHLETTVDRIKAVDRAAAMVEEMLKQASVSNGVKPFSTCVFLGFDADPDMNIAARIRGPNDQYVNHIMNETGATVLLRGHGSANPESAQGEEVQQPLHLFLSSSNAKSLEHAKLLAENLMDTISAECGASRISSSKIYGAVPPPHQLLDGVQSSVDELKANAATAFDLTPPAVGYIPVLTACPATVPGVASILPQGTTPQTVGPLNSGLSQPSIPCYPQPSLSGGTSYSGYGGIYPQATPLQQVALALRHSTSPVTSTVASTTAVSTASDSIIDLSSEKEKRPQQRRKFQELPAKIQQGDSDRHESSSDCRVTSRSISNMPAPRKLVKSLSDVMPPPPPRAMPPYPAGPMPPPPARTMHPPAEETMVPLPPKFNSGETKVHDSNTSNGLKAETVPGVSDTLVKLMEYGDDDDDLEETTESFRSNPSPVAAAKPFWAV